MDFQKQLERLGEPDAELGALRIWIHERQYPALQDYWDGNWLTATAYCGESWNEGAAAAFVTGPILHRSDIEQWVPECSRIHASLVGKAALACIEPNLDILCEMGPRGRLAATVRLCPNALKPAFEFALDLDQSHLTEFLRGLHRILADYPSRGERPARG